jgi:hypothetical protein
MAPKDFTDSPCLFHDDDNSSCSSCEESDIIVNNQKQTTSVVRFNAQCYLKFYSKPTETDRANAWYTRGNFQQFKMHSKLVAKAARNGLNVEGEEMIFGLDNQNRKKSNLKAKRRHLTCDLVMNGQEDDTTCPLAIAAQCSQVSEGSSNDAVTSATMLHMSLLLHEDENMIVRTTTTTSSKKILTRKSSFSTRPGRLTTVSQVA